MTKAPVITEINQPVNRVISVQMESLRFIEHHCTMTLVARWEPELSIKHKHKRCESDPPGSGSITAHVRYQLHCLLVSALQPTESNL